MTEILERFQGCCWFALLDLFTGYHQIPLMEEDMLKTSFVCWEGMYHWTVMPFGLTEAPGTFQRMMKKVLAGVPEARAFIDNISLGAADFDKLLCPLDWVNYRGRSAWCSQTRLPS
jgi:hypothetical protein